MLHLTSDLPLTNWKLRLPRIEDWQELLEFERKNRSWFEQWVVPRKEEFYCESGVKAHLEQCLCDYANERMHPTFIVNGAGAIIGRANLKDIDLKSSNTELGYRLGKEYIGKGLASAVAAEMTNLAFEKWNLMTVKAYANVNNHASARVLEKCGFLKGALFPAHSKLKDQTLDCYQYVLHAAAKVMAMPLSGHTLP